MFGQNKRTSQNRGHGCLAAQGVPGCSARGRKGPHGYSWGSVRSWSHTSISLLFSPAFFVLRQEANVTIINSKYKFYLSKGKAGQNLLGNPLLLFTWLEYQGLGNSSFPVCSKSHKIFHVARTGNPISQLLDQVWFNRIIQMGNARNL